MVDEVRYDPIWRRIKTDRFAAALEGALPAEMRRLDGLNNWGALSWLHDHATATKLAHHYGVEHNAQEYLRADDTRAVHAPYFRPAAHLLHWGHVPLSYQGEEAILRAAHIDGSAEDALEVMLDAVIAFGALDCDDQSHGHGCVERIRTGSAPFELYRWLSAWKITRRWPRIWRAIRRAAPDSQSLDEAVVKQRLTRALVCRGDPGYEIVSRCNLADYVLRDLLQAGTAWLMVDSGALWDRNPLGPDKAQEWGLLYAAALYLEDRFYQTPDALLIHTLVARVVAQAILTKHRARAVQNLVASAESDEEFASGLPDYHRRRMAAIRVAARRLAREWTHVGRFNEISVPDTTRLSVEDWLTSRSGTGRLSYPFTAGFSVIVSLGSQRPEYFAGSDRRYVFVDVHYKPTVEGRRSAALPVLDVLSKLSEWIGPVEKTAVGTALGSWFLESRAEQRPFGCEEGLRGAAASDQSLLISTLKELRNRSSVRPLNDHPYAASLADYIIETEGKEPRTVGLFLLGLPWKAVCTAAGRRLLEGVRECALAAASNSTGDGSRGHALEAAVMADQLLDDAPDFRFMVVGATLLKEDGNPSHEWDSIRIDLTGSKWSVTAVECAISRSQQKDDRARETLDLLGQRLQGRFPDLTRYDTRLATVGGTGTLEYEDARRGFGV